MTELDGETQRIFGEHDVFRQIINTLNLHSQKHGVISRTMFIIICHNALKNTDVKLEGIND